MNDEDRHDDRLARWAKSGKAGRPPVPAATVILLREGAGGVETLMLRRNSKIAFGGMWVFPGGRVDAADVVGLDPDDDLAAARRAAVREAEEETGLMVEAEALVPVSHWTPPLTTPRRFLTWFFVAAAPRGEVRIDEGEIHEHDWMSPARAFEKRDEGEIEIAPPTFVTLHALSQHARAADAIAAFSGRAPEYFATRISVQDQGPVALWQGDAGWERADASILGPRHRLSMHRGVWRYDRDFDA